MPIEKLKPTFSLDEERINKLKQLIPEAFADGKIYWESLQAGLGEHIENDEPGSEHFGLFWPGKRDAKRLASLPSKGTLVPCPGEGVDENTTRNIFIEGENLEVLKILQKSYAGKIKMIYIDPPYNTGNDFVYDDDYTEPLEEYLRRTGQLDEQGKPLTTNKKSDGRFHSKWLSMMYPRLKLARNLLSDDGVIFVSIDDNEIFHLRSLMNEIFGEENWVHTLKWKRKKQPSFLHGHVASVMEYILIYGNDKNDLEKLSIEKRSDLNTRIDNAANKSSLRELKKGVRVKADVQLIKKGVYKNKSMETEYLNDVFVKNGRTQNDITIKAQFRNEQKEIDKFIENDVLFITKNLGLRRDLLQEELEKRKSITDLLLDWGDNQESDNEMKDLFPKGKPFLYPKPTLLIKNLINSIFSEGSIVMDFFAGSGTTAHAIMDLVNSTYSLNYILVQMNETPEEQSEAFKLGYKSISEIAIDRIKRAYKKIKKEKLNQDIGFKVFELITSNYKSWQSYKGTNLNELETLFEKFESPLVEDWKEENLLTEIILIEGFPLDSKMEVLEEYKKNKVHQVVSDFCEHKLLICLDKKVYVDTIRNLKLGEKDIFICLDNAISDQEKVTLLIRD